MNATAESINARPKTTIVFTCILAALAGLMFGLDIGVISGATQFIQKEFRISDHMIEWIVSSMMLGAAIGALGAGCICQSKKLVAIPRSSCVISTSGPKVRR